MKADLYIDQWGNRFYARTRKDLKAQIPGKVAKVYQDKKDGSVVSTGYVIGDHWLTAYKRVEEGAK
jgi:hypothetical protein